MRNGANINEKDVRNILVGETDNLREQGERKQRERVRESESREREQIVGDREQRAFVLAYIIVNNSCISSFYSECEFPLFIE